MAIRCEKDISEGMKAFNRWYSAVDFGNGISVDTNHPPSYRVKPGAIETGAGKWNYIIRRNLPDLQGKRVLDIGSNNGVMCVMAARSGAAEVMGLDSDLTWKDWPKQAEFVREALEWRCKTKYPIKFVNSDIRGLSKLNLGNFDVVLALCCLYYLSDSDIESLLKYLQQHAEYVVIQCNTSGVHDKETNRKATPKYMGDALKRAGFKFIHFDIPFFYRMPVVVGSNKPLKKKGRFSFGSIKAWLREKF